MRILTKHITDKIIQLTVKENVSLADSSTVVVKDYNCIGGNYYNNHNATLALCNECLIVIATL